MDLGHFKELLFFIFVTFLGYQYSIPNIKMYIFFHHKNDKEKFLAPKTKPWYLFKISQIHLRHPM